ncbi:galactonate dehydratase [Fibrella aquatilis]|uniref:Galactonate dehydratase n=1 Tax=Fibrella aquatilis TaxID=2817059 RepID=A0A939G422_9BACT|nr:galactonate dehydratase [Fibrella aquatilis]MBO0931977.1 galactonate dehydratase [Fibrella aquatilis]
MRITDIKTLVVNAHLRNWIFVKVETDQGLYGWGEATLEWKTRAVVGAINDLKPLLIGEDARDITRLSEIMTKHSFWQLGVIGKTAISGIDIALWDIRGKALGEPVWRLLGGKTHDKIKLYTHLGLGESTAVYDSLETNRVIEQALEVIETGYRALKVVFIPYINYTASLREVKHVENMMGRLREAVGNDIDIMVDFHGRPGSASAAVQFIKALEPAHPLFVEEVIQPGDPMAMRDIRNKILCPLATGERLTSAAEFEKYFMLRAIDVAQPDLCHCGGFTEAMRIGAMAAVAGIGIAPHNPLGPIAGVAALHYDIATPNFIIQERMEVVPWFHDVIDGHPDLRNGYWLLPEEPGLGIEINEDVAAQHPYKQEPTNVIQAATISDGTIVHW